MSARILHTPPTSAHKGETASHNVIWIDDDDVILISDDETEELPEVKKEFLSPFTVPNPKIIISSATDPRGTIAKPKEPIPKPILQPVPTKTDLISKVCSHGPLRTVAAAIETLNEEVFVCDSRCMCKIVLRAQESINHHRRGRSRPVEIVSHKWHGGHLFLHCKLDSSRTCLEYLKVCQVPAEIRHKYSLHLENCQTTGTIPKASRKWTVEAELALREELYPSLTKEQIRCQEDLTNCMDTAEWEAITRNGRGTVTLPRAQKVPEKARPPAVLATATEEFYEVERVVAAEVDAGRLSFLIKWIGYPLEESTWEPQAAVQMSRDAVDQFITTYGKPSKNNPKVYSPEGEAFLESKAAKSKKKKELK